MNATVLSVNTVLTYIARSHYRGIVTDAVFSLAGLLVDAILPPIKLFLPSQTGNSGPS